MARKNIATKTTPARWYRGTDIPMRVIRRFARQVGERFQPDKIILFGSYAYGVPHADSDVDILVVMPARQQHTQAFRIRWAIHAPFPMDPIVRTPKNLQWRLEEGDSFHTEIVTKGKVLYRGLFGRHEDDRRPAFTAQRGDTGAGGGTGPPRGAFAAPNVSGSLPAD